MPGFWNSYFYSFKIVYTDEPYLFLKNLLWIQFLGGTIPNVAKHSATVLLFLSYNSGSWFHFSGGVNPYDANIIATVWLYLFVNFGSCIQHFGVL